MKIVIFGLTISSSWGNGHATLWRGLCKGLARLGHDIVFFERDEPYYAATRDWHTLPHGKLVLFKAWNDVRQRAHAALYAADAAIVTSFCPDANEATAEILDAGRPLAVFYDLDTPVTLMRWQAGKSIPYVSARGLGEFDLVLSYTGGGTLEALQALLGARAAAPLYGHVDPDAHHPVSDREHYRAALSYLGTYAADRQEKLERLFVEPARRHPTERFLIAGAQYPSDFPWTENVFFLDHLPPAEHAAFFSSCRLTLNVTRAAMARMGWCPSGRLFEAAACGAAILSDEWPGIDEFYTRDREILIARDTQDALSALSASDAQLRRVAHLARERTLDEHTCHHRAHALCMLLERASVTSLRRAQPITQASSRY